jgi:hypothetical protein
MITVYFETENGSYSEIVATFSNEKIYLEHLPLLEAQARSQAFIVTESDDSDINELLAESIKKDKFKDKITEIWAILLRIGWGTGRAITREEAKKQVLSFLERTK